MIVRQCMSVKQGTDKSVPSFRFMSFFKLSFLASLSMLTLICRLVMRDVLWTEFCVLFQFVN